VAGALQSGRRAARQSGLRADVLALLALLAREAPAQTVAAAAGVDPRAVLDALSGLTAAGLFRLGAQASPAAWGTAAMPLDGSLGLRMPEPIAWEEYTGRAASGQLGAQLADVMLRAAEVLAALRLPAILMRDIAAFAMQEVIDRAHPAYFDDWLAVAFTARDLTDDRFADYISALTAGGPLIPEPGTPAIQ
jgi:hypothetical protein